LGTTTDYSLSGSYVMELRGYLTDYNIYNTYTMNLVLVDICPIAVITIPAIVD